MRLCFLTCDGDRTSIFYALGQGKEDADGCSCSRPSAEDSKPFSEPKVEASEDEGTLRYVCLLQQTLR